MLSELELMANLAYHEQVYNAAGGNLRVMLLSSKASILEACGWLEQAMDLIVSNAATRCALSAARIKLIDKDYIKKTNGFSYQGHFEKMMVSVIGYRMLEAAEARAGNLVQAMDGALTYLTPLRNYYAHTHFNIASPFPKDMTSIPGPTATRSHAETAIVGLTAIEQALIDLHC